MTKNYPLMKDVKNWILDSFSFMDGIGYDIQFADDIFGMENTKAFSIDIDGLTDYDFEKGKENLIKSVPKKIKAEFPYLRIGSARDGNYFVMFVTLLDNNDYLEDRKLTYINLNESKKYTKKSLKESKLYTYMIGVEPEDWTIDDDKACKRYGITCKGYYVLGDNEGMVLVGTLSDIENFVENYFGAGIVEDYLCPYDIFDFEDGEWITGGWF